MKYFLDTEFIEGFHKPLFGNRRHFIDLVSIGIVCEDGRSYYAVSSEFNSKNANSWVIDNVIFPMIPQYIQTFHGDMRNRVIDQYENKGKHGSIKVLQNSIGQRNEVIKTELLQFFGCWRDQYFWRAPEGIEVYGYFADYDWVLFCSLFGRMIDLPKGFPMYCKDLKQTLDNHALTAIAMQTMGRESDLNDGLKFMKSMDKYPKQTNEHNALADAKWNYELYKFLTHP